METINQDDNNLFEVKMKRLEEIVDTLQSGEISLERSMELYKEGMLCSRFCREKLENAKHELESWQEGENKESEITLDLEE